MLFPRSLILLTLDLPVYSVTPRMRFTHPGFFCVIALGAHTAPLTLKAFPLCAMLHGT